MPKFNAAGVAPFSLGGQSRWTNILGQHLGAKATLSPTGLTKDKMESWTEEQTKTRFEDDRHNREVFEESMEIIRDGKVVWSFRGTQSEVNTVQAVGDGLPEVLRRLRPQVAAVEAVKPPSTTMPPRATA